MITNRLLFIHKTDCSTTRFYYTMTANCNYIRLEDYMHAIFLQDDDNDDDTTYTRMSYRTP